MKMSTERVDIKWELEYRLSNLIGSIETLQSSGPYSDNPDYLEGKIVAMEEEREFLEKLMEKVSTWYIG